MSSIAKLFCGITLLTVPTIMYGGYFLLTVLSGRTGDTLNDFQRAMFRAGHAHAGVLIILSLVAQVLADHATLSPTFTWAVRIAFPLSAMLISGGFFGAAAGEGVTQPTKLINILYTGIAVLVFAVVTLGIGLLKRPIT